ncbi:tetratricopeptide repeat protein [Phenylobacterium sp.]|uniref:tetratricopeptide repeat protein n=1 Tax=Phenylobacterium sp. TaxID=1871053 RepID=UPI00286B9C6C|nr:tetratricopeptide repeat protein [Phenylobacterium sp.]
MVRAIIAAVIAALALVAWSPVLAGPSAMELTESALEHLKAGRLDAVVADADAALAIDPRMAPAYLLRGDVHQARGNYGGAIKDYSAAITINPDLDLARLNRGIANINLGDFESAVEDLEKAARDRSLESKARGELSVALRHLGRHRQALAEVDRAYRLKPIAQWLVVRGDILLANGEPGMALKTFTDALADPKERLTALDGRARAHFELRDYARAIADYEKIIAEAPDSVAALNDLCWTRAVARSGLAQAEIACDRALKLTPEDPLVYATRAYLWLAFARPDAALADAEAATRFDPDYPDGRFLRAVALERLGRGAEAAVEMSVALKLDPEIARTYAGHGMSPQTVSSQRRD